MPNSLSLRARDLHAVLRVVEAPAENVPDDASPVQGLPWPVLISLAELIPCDQVSFFELDSTTRRVAFGQDLDADGRTDNAVDDDDDADAVFWANYWQCEACCYPDVSGDVRSVTMLSDFYTAREKRRIGMYTDYLRPAGVEHEVMACLPVAPQRTMRLVLFRGPGPDFTGRDRAVLALLRPHLRELFRDRRDATAPPLTGRQQQLLRLVADGHTNLQIARRLAISEGTVRKHMENIFDRLGVTSRTAAVAQVFAHSAQR